MASSLEVVKEIFRYLSREIDLASFRDWLVGLRLDHAEELDEASKQLIADLDGCYAEFSDGLVSEDFLRVRFRRIVVDLMNIEAKAQVADNLLFVAFDKPVVNGYTASGSGGVGSSDALSTSTTLELAIT